MSDFLKIFNSLHFLNILGLTIFSCCNPRGMFIICNALICYSCFVHSCFTEAYRKECLATTVKLLEKLCKGVKLASFTQNYPNIPVACMNLVASVSDFVHSGNRQRVREVNLRKQDFDCNARLHFRQTSLANLKYCANLI